MQDTDSLLFQGTESLRRKVDHGEILSEALAATCDDFHVTGNARDTDAAGGKEIPAFTTLNVDAVLRRLEHRRMFRPVGSQPGIGAESISGHPKRTRFE